MAKELHTRESAKAAIRKAPTGARFYVRIRNDAPIEGQPNSYFPCGLSSYVPVSRKEAIWLVDSMISPTLEARGARFPVDVIDGGYWLAA